MEILFSVPDFEGSQLVEERKAEASILPRINSTQCYNTHYMLKTALLFIF